MRLIGLDIGEKRIGVAVSDPSGSVATPLTVLDAARTMGDGRDLIRIISDYEAEGLVVGLPLTMGGTEGPQATRARRVAERLSLLTNTRLIFCDERLSSAEASRRMREAGVSEKGQRGSKDMVAASIFLQSYLDSQRIEVDGHDSREADDK